MSLISVATIYGDTYANDKLFDISACKLGENLTFPYIMLQKRWNDEGNQCHTADVNKTSEVDIYLFCEIPADSLLVLRSVFGFIKYLLKMKFKRDHLLKAVLRGSRVKRYLLIMEPPIISRNSYDIRFHKYFDKIFTWNDSLLSNPDTVRLFFPQTAPARKYLIPFAQKRLLTLIASNKDNSDPHELYSQRKRVIRYFETQEQDAEFDLYGYGWEREGLKNYRGCIAGKYEVLSRYKFCVAFENMTHLNGYFTEKLFDCFFANCVPVYWGGDNVDEYIPENTFIDMRRFSSVEEMYRFISAISPEEYDEYIENIRQYLASREFADTFSVDAFVKCIIENAVPPDGHGR